MVVLSVVDIVLLIAGLAFYLYVVGGQLDPDRRPTSRSAASWCARSSANAELIEPGVEHINRTGGVVAGALPLLYGMAEGIVAGATPQPEQPAERPPARPAVGPAPVPAARRRRLSPDGDGSGRHLAEPQVPA